MKTKELLNGAIQASIPKGEALFEDYSVTINGVKAPLYQVRVSAVPFNRSWPGKQRDINQTETAGMLTFDMTAPVELAVETKLTVNSAVVRPLSAGIVTKIEDNIIRFEISHPGQFSLEINGRHNNLHIFANEPIEKKTPVESYTYYFKAGVHNVGTLILHSDDKVFLEAGSVVYGAIQAFDAENISIEGRGILDYSNFERLEPFQYERTGLINFVRCRNVTVDGVILRNSSWWTITSINCSNLYFHNVKCVGMWRYNTDGFDFVCCQNVHVDSCFLRNFDDVIVFKGYNLGDFGITPVSPEGKASQAYNLQNNENCLVENCVIWCDWGGAIELGAETATDEYVNLVFRNCDIIHVADGAMRIQSGDRATIHQILYDNIRVEYDGNEKRHKIQRSDDEIYISEDGCYISDVIRGWMYCNKWSKAGLLGNVYDITYRNISVSLPEGLPMPEINFKGEDREHGFWNVKIEGFKCNGKEIKPAIIGNEFTDIEYKQ